MKNVLMTALALLLAAPLVLPTALGGGSGHQAELSVYAIEGFLVTSPSRSFEGGQVKSLSGAIYVPGVRTTLENLGAGTTSPPRRTDLSGRFLFTGQEPGRYRVCWKASGFTSACREVAIVDRDLHLGPLAIVIARRPGAIPVHGTVRLADGSIPRFFEPFASVNAFAVVRAQVGSRRVAGDVFVNNAGDYILPAVPIKPVPTIRGRIEGASVVVTPSGLAGVTSKRVNLKFANNPPQSDGIVATAPAGTHWTAKPGDTVKFVAKASDKDGNPIGYRWVPPPGIAPATASGASTSFELPASPGMYEFMVVVSDRKGGYDKDAIWVTTGAVHFSGKVSGTDAAVVPGAEVEVGGVATRTDARGRFNLYVRESRQYVLNIRKNGYALVSRIYDVGRTGLEYTLTRASVSTVNPTGSIDVVNERRPSDCPGSLSERLKRKGQRKCGPGIRVKIPANSLVDSGGKAPAGPVRIELSTVDLDAPDAMPGDWTARSASGATRVMESFGAGTVEINAGGREYNLKAGATAQVTIPIPAEQLAVPGRAKPTIPLLSYDEKRGLWIQVGTATRSGDTYVGNVKHFTAINMDELKVDQACVRVESTLMPDTYNLEVTFTRPTASMPETRTTLITDNGAQRFHVLYNLPLNQNLTFRALTDEPTPKVIKLLVGQFPTPPADQITVNSGPTPQNPTTPNRPAWPYTACRRAVELSPAIRGVAPGDRLVPNPAADAFLTGLYSFRAINLDEPTNAVNVAAFEASTADYYATIDPGGARTTLTGFRTANGFGNLTTGAEYSAQYANSGDLGFGRDMNCRRTTSGPNTGDVACYVSNYGNRFTDDIADATDAYLATHPASLGGGTAPPLVATVGMEYSPASGTSPRIVKFYVFDAAGNRVGAADLDGFGQRSVPGLCMVCHGKQYTNPPLSSGAPVFNPADPLSANLNARFIPFDFHALDVPTIPLPVGGTVDLKSTQQQAFKDLNLEIVGNTGVPLAEQEVLDRLYNNGSSATQIEHYSVSGWAAPSTGGTEPSEPDVYDKVVSPSCRSCHLSQAPSAPAPSGPGDIDWSRASQFNTHAPSIAYRVCNEHSMPHAIVTHNRFWFSSPFQPLILHDFINGTTAANTPGSLGVSCVNP